MSVLGHVAVGVVAARAVNRSQPEPGAARLGTMMAGLTILALLPDADFLLPALVPISPSFDHRGITHSLTFAVLIGLITAWVLLVTQSDRPLAWGILVAAVVATHGLLDLLGQSQLGVELLWPFSTVRLTPWQLLPDPSLAPPLARNFLGPLTAELVLFLPAWLYAFVPRSVLHAAFGRTHR